MRRRMEVLMNSADEKEVMDRIKALGQVTFIEYFAKTEEALYTTEFLHPVEEHSCYYIWNRAFDWTPELGMTIAGDVFISNVHQAPVIRYSRRRMFPKKMMIVTLSMESPESQEQQEQLMDWFTNLCECVLENAKCNQSQTEKTYYILPNAWEILHTAAVR